MEGKGVMISARILDALTVRFPAIRKERINKWGFSSAPAALTKVKSFPINNRKVIDRQNNSRQRLNPLNFLKQELPLIMLTVGCLLITGLLD
jgi:hypothetical protein